MPPPVAWCNFDTAIGACALAWRGDVLWSVRIGAEDTVQGDAGTGHGDGAESDLAAGLPPPAWVTSVVERIQRLLQGESVRFDDVPLAWERVPEPHRRVYALTSALPAGSTTTYGEIARQLGEPGAARAVGQALGRNPWPIVVPCHRVLAAGGGLGGFSAPGGATTKLRLLEIERAWPGGQASLFGR